MGNLALTADGLKLLVTIGALAVARTTGLMLITPFLGSSVLTGMARNAVILSLSLPTVPMLLATLPNGTAPGVVETVLLTIKETLLGVLLGLPIAVTSWGLEASGFIIDNQRGATMASSMNVLSGNQTSPLGVLMSQLYTTWLFVAGGFVAVLELLYRSHAAWPIWSYQPNFGPGLPSIMLGLLDDVMRIGILMAGPAMVAMFLSEFGLALVSKFAPSLQVFFLAMPLKSAVGLLMLLLSLGIILSTTAEQVPGPAALLAQVAGWLR